MPASKAVTRTASRARRVTRRRTLLVLAVTAMLVVPAAISWACGPNRAISLDRTDYAPGATVTVTGANFDSFANVTINVNGLPVTSTSANAGGNISASFTAPNAPGAYTVVTSGVDQQGQALAGTGRAESFTVTAPASTTPAPSGGGGAPSSGNTTPAPSGTTGTAPGATRQNARNKTSGREPTRSGGRSNAGAGRQGSGSGSGSGAATGTSGASAGVIKTAAGTAFAGSVSRQDRTAAAAKAKAKAQAAPSTSKARPSPATASADLWSGFASSKNPSLMPSTGDSGVPAPGTSTGVVAGLGLLGVGLLALLGLGGLAVAGRRRRSRARAE